MAHIDPYNFITHESLDEPTWGPLSVGDEVERYEVVRALGVGGMAQVYEVRHKELGVRYALKLLHTQSPSSMVRLMREGRTQARLDHPNIVKVRDVFLARGVPALLMDHVDGVTLGEWARAKERSERELLGVFTQLVDAVAHAHDASVVHRDLKPGNVLVSKGDVVHVTDFGIAKHVSHETGDAAGTLTQAGGVLGTPMYMAPEQFRDAGSVDARADVFALGVILYELCCGRRPFEAQNPFDLLEKMEASDYAPVVRLAPDLSAPVRDAIASCLKPREDRLASARALLGLLETVEGPPPPHESPRPTRRWAYALAGAAVTALAAAAVSSARPTDSPTAPLEPEAARPDHSAALERQVRAAKLESIARRRAEAEPGIALALLRAAASELEPDERRRVLDAPTLDRWRRRGAAVTSLPLGQQAFSVKFSPSGALLAVGGIEGTLQVWDLARAELMFEWNIEDFGSVKLMDFSPDEASLIIVPSKRNRSTNGQDPQPARLVSTRTGETLRTFAHGQFTRSMQTDSTFERAITTAFDSRVIIWDMSTSAPLRVLKAAGLTLVPDRATALAPSGEWVAFVDNSPPRVRVFDVETGALVHELFGPNKDNRLHVGELAFTPDSERLILANSTELVIWNVRTGERLFDENIDAFGMLELSNGGLFVEGSKSGEFRLRDIERPAEYVKVEGEAWIYNLDFADDAETFATASSDGTVGLWDARTGTQRTRLFGARSWVLDVDVSSGVLPRIAAAGRDGLVRLYDDVTRDIEARSPPFEDQVLFRTWSLDGRTLALMASEGELWRWREGQGWSRLVVPPKTSIKRMVVHDDGAIYAAASYDVMLKYAASENTPTRMKIAPGFYISPSLGAGLLCANSSRTLWMLDTVTGEIVREEHTTRVRAHEVAGDDSWCAYANDERELVFMPSTPDGETRRGRTSGLPSLMRSSSDGQKLAIGTWHDTAEIWDAHSAERIALLEGHEDSVVALAWAPKHLITGSLDRTLMVWDIETGARVHTLEGHTRDVTAVEVEPGGRAVWSASKDGTLRRWDLETGESTRVVTLPERAVAVRVGEDEVVALGIDGVRYAFPSNGSSEEDPLTRTGAWTNLRVCEGTFEVRAVTPLPAPETVWAPRSLCDEP